MSALKRFWRSVFDIRPGEYRKTLFMALYLMLVLFAYYILKPVSRALFLNSFDIDKLPWLYVLIAAIGGVLAYLYTKMAVRSSLGRAVDLANIFCTVVLVGFWWLIQVKQAWVIYAFNIWVSLFSIILVSQGWLVAANVFTPREAKRLYGILGVGSVIGAAFGGQFTAVMVYYIGTTNLVLACAGMVVLSYVAYRMAIASAGTTLKAATAAQEEDFSFAEIARAIRGTRHLQVIIAIISITFVVDVLVEFQFSAMAKQSYQGRDLTAFLGNFYGFWLNLVTFVLQLFLTSFVVSRFGVGGTLQIMPVSIAVASISALVFPSLLSTAAARITEASTRYSFNKTGTELLYLPLPLELRNRTKAFVDVFIDRMARGAGGIILVLLTTFLDLKVQQFAIVVLFFAAIWIGLSVVAQREYLATVRKKLELRRLDLGSSRVTVTDRAVLKAMEKTVREGQPRQAAYALGLLAEAAGYDPGPLALERVSAAEPELRAKAFDVLRERGDNRAREAALELIRATRSATAGADVEAAVAYVLALDPNPAEPGRRLLDHPSETVRLSAMAALIERPELVAGLIDSSRLRIMAESTESLDRQLAAMAIRALPDQYPLLQRLLIDAESPVAAEAMRTAAVLQKRELLPQLIHNLSSARVRGAAIEALASFGTRIAGTLSDLMEDRNLPMQVRRQVPRILARIPEQRSVDILIGVLGSSDLTIRTAALKALNKLRETAPKLQYDVAGLASRVHDEARYYFELWTAMSTLREFPSPPPATSLLIRTLEQRLRETLERLFRLIGLKYPPQQIYAAYLAVSRRKGDDFTAALEFLDNVLERELKKIVIPLLDEDGVLAQRAQDLFQIEEMDAVTALRKLMASGEPWLVACAMAAAAELQLREVAGDIRRAGDSCGPDVAGVARSAEKLLA